jgi:hypothetical protein
MGGPLETVKTIKLHKKECIVAKLRATINISRRNCVAVNKYHLIIGQPTLIVVTFDVGY